MPNRSFWVDAKESLEQNSKTATLSSRILGIGIIFVSFLVLSIGLIVGLKFPGFVEERIKEDQCIVSDESSNYKQWEFDEQLVRTEKLYYWNITNHDAVLEQGEVPNYQRLGPYIYNKRATKTNIGFRDGFASFKYLISFDFDEDATLSECGTDCAEDNEITVINTEQMEDIVNFKTDENYFLGNIPEWINLKIEELSARQTNITGNIFSLLGVLNDTLIIDSYEENVVRLVHSASFGLWIGLNDIENKVSLNNLRNGTDFSTLEMRKLYNILSSDSLSGIPTEPGLLEDCRNFISTNKCSLHQTILNISNLQQPDTSVDVSGLNYSNFRNICGLVLLLKYLNASNIHCFLNSSDWVQDLFCFPYDSDCRTFQSNYTYMSIFLLNVKSLIFDYMYIKVKQWTAVNTRDNLFRTLNVRQLSLGYNLHAGFVPGQLTQNMTKESDNLFSLAVKYSTCLMNRKSANNMVLYEYQGINTSPSLSKIILYTYFVPPLVKFKTCVSHRPFINFFYLFVEEFSCVIPFEQQLKTGCSGIDVFRYSPDFTRCPVSNNIRCCNKRNQYQHYIYSFSGSYVDIEPISGNIWRKVIRENQTLSFSTDARDIIDNILKLDITNYSFPVCLRESSVVVSSNSVGKYKLGIKQMMDASCAAMISLSVVASFVFISAIAVLFWPKTKTKVHPFILEQSHNLTHSRH